MRVKGDESFECDRWDTCNPRSLTFQQRTVRNECTHVERSPSRFKNTENKMCSKKKHVFPKDLLFLWIFRDRIVPSFDGRNAQRGRVSHFDYFKLSPSTRKRYLRKKKKHIFPKDIFFLWISRDCTVHSFDRRYTERVGRQILRISIIRSCVPQWKIDRYRRARFGAVCARCNGENAFASRCTRTNTYTDFEARARACRGLAFWRT